MHFFSTSHHMMRVCASCTNSSLSGHRVHTFPNRKRNGTSFHAWVRFVQVKRQDFSAVCGAHFRQENYLPGDTMEFRMGFQSQDQVRLTARAVPSVPTAASSSPLSVAASDSAAGGSSGYGPIKLDENANCLVF